MFQAVAEVIFKKCYGMVRPSNKAFTPIRVQLLTLGTQAKSLGLSLCMIRSSCALDRTTIEEYLY